MFYKSTICVCVITSPVLIKMKGIWIEVTGYVSARATKIESPWTSVSRPTAAGKNLSDYMSAVHPHF